MSVTTFLPSIPEDFTIWEADLSDGTTVYQDDRIGEPKSVNAWLRLKQYVEENKLDIVRIRIRFRDHVEKIPEDVDGYYFSYGFLGCCGIKNQSKRNNMDFYIFGILKDNKVKCVWFKVPEIMAGRIQTKELSEINPEQLILKLDKVPSP